MMKILNPSECKLVSGAGGGIGEALHGIAHVAEGAAHVYNAATGDNVGEGLGKRWGSAGASDYCKDYATQTDDMDQGMYNDCMKNPAKHGYKDPGPW
ncbi:hypothetical protein CGA24_00720 (plasmid) [Salmonella enterica subsp. enterica]|uniref:hypothetical protein n=1 Tax=Salmonella enterica TaxID=28901 RepID=UPI000BE447AF|nr:hypothetical protein [Salmonella enterica]ATI83656.1 hypothetical protein CGA24_00720 [Salmonella enterica subsp. enterica]EJQ0716782.1 hypothetical protein [Salmonella enterica]